MPTDSRAAEFLAELRAGRRPQPAAIRELGEASPGEFFRDLVEPLADSFEPDQSAAYEFLMQAWLPLPLRVTPVVPARVDTVFVLSRVTLGADIKIVSPILATAKRRFPDARIVFVANRKSAELFAADPRIEHHNADYPRTGPVSARLRFAEELAASLQAQNAIVIDPDSRMTQLGLIPVCDADRYFHFPSRTAGGESDANLSVLVAEWLYAVFGMAEPAWIGPLEEAIGECGAFAAISLGVGENESKRVAGDFEARLLAAVGGRYETLWVDRGVGGGEAARVTAAVEASGVAKRVRFWEGGFAGFASIAARASFYTGYDSAGQHAAAAAGVRLISIFAGAPSERFRARWSAAGRGAIHRIDADGQSPEAILGEFTRLLPLN